jgi:hypothetical protein
MVRKVIAMVLIAMLSLQCFYKLACVTYYQLNKDYIAEFLCVNRDNPITVCYGQCFLKKALGFESETTTNSIASNLKFDLPLFKLSEIVLIRSAISNPKKYSVSKNHLLKKDDHTQPVFRPPLV